MSWMTIMLNEKLSKRSILRNIVSDTLSFSYRCKVDTETVSTQEKQQLYFESPKFVIAGFIERESNFLNNCKVL